MDKNEYTPTYIQEHSHFSKKRKKKTKITNRLRTEATTKKINIFLKVSLHNRVACCHVETILKRDFVTTKSFINNNKKKRVQFKQENFMQI